MNKVLVLGSAGYIGGSVCSRLLEGGNKVTGIDSLVNSKIDNTLYLEKKYPNNFRFIKADLVREIEKIILETKNEKFDVIIHFAALKSVEESQSNPELYWKNNVISTLNVLDLMSKKGIRKIIYSSSATVYGERVKSPILETQKFDSISCYGSTKIANELLLNDYANSGKIDALSLRYFNPGGVLENKIFKDYIDGPNIFPKLIKSSIASQSFKIFGTDYPTRDGTPERDYIHIKDLVSGHISGMNFISQFKGYESVNLGTGRSTSIHELIKAFENGNNIKLDVRHAQRRSGDIAVCYANVDKAKNILGWTAKCDVNDICRDLIDFYK
ncbi:MAG: UDP-glucose 4-epimerase GalE [SAR86 cluster bacterium]|nr:UDP-glucose 4-epimerase GalE [SAR86 cluster bacterium]